MDLKIKTETEEFHGIEFYYIIKPKQQLQMIDCEKVEIDKGKEKLLEFKWVTS